MADVILKGSKPTIRALHEEAMERAQLADIARHDGNMDEVKRLATEGYLLEKKAASRLLIAPANEPSRSILYRSAAWLAMQAELYQEAFDLGQEGCKGYPPAPIKSELADVINAAWEAMHGEQP